MLKWFVGLLLLANVGALMWILWYSQPEVEPIIERVEVAPDKLRPIRERGVPLQQRAPKPVPTPKAPPNALCFRLGPFPDREAASGATVALGTLQLTHETREEKQMTVTGYRVYLPSFRSKALAEKARQQLRRQGFRDHAVMTEAGMKNAVSLGVFSVETNARRHLRNLAKKGFKAQLQLQHQVKSRYWLDVRALPDQAEALRALSWKDKEVQLVPDAACAPLPAPVPPVPPVGAPASNHKPASPKEDAE